MYTVIRVTTPKGHLDTIDAIGKSMNDIRVGVYQGIRKAGDGFSCSVSEEADWEQHAAAIVQFADEFTVPLRRLVDIGASVTFDVAVEPEDRDPPPPILALHADPALLAVLARGGMGLEISIY